VLIASDETSAHEVPPDAASWIRTTV
jgi:hypothetical protein